MIPNINLTSYLTSNLTFELSSCLSYIAPMLGFMLGIC